MNNNTATVITEKTLLLSLLLAGLLLAALPVCGQSMIPEDFDWSYYYQNDDWDSWGSAPDQNYYQDNYGYQQPITYDWY